MKISFDTPFRYLERLVPFSPWLVLAAVVLPRMLWFTYLGGQLPVPVRDQALYIHTAGRILEGHGLSFSSELGAVKNGRFRTDGPQSIWTEDPGFIFGVAPVETPTAVMEPGYAVLLAAFFGVFGGVAGGAFALNLAFSIAGAFAVRKLVSDFQGQVAGMTASVLWALYPPYVYYTAYAMSEVAHFSLLMVTLMLLFSAGRGKGTGFAAGAATAAFFLVRATALFLLPLEMLYLVWRKKWKQLLFIAVGFAVAVSPWVIRNAVELGSPVLLPTKGSLNLWMRNHPEVLALEGILVPEDIEIHSSELLQYPAMDTIPDELTRCRLLGESATGFMRSNPRLMFWLAWNRAGRFLAPGGDTLGGRARLFGYVFYCIMLVGLAGLWRNRKAPEAVFLMAVFLFYLALHSMAHGGVRYRLPVDAVFLIGTVLCAGCGRGRVCAG